MALKTDYKDDILDTSTNTRRRFTMIQNDDGTVSFDDVTSYNQTGDPFGANDINTTNIAINKIVKSVGNYKITLVSTSAGLLIDKNTLKCTYYIGNNDWDNAMVFAQLVFDGAKCYDVKGIAVDSVVSDGIIQAYAMSDGLFSAGDSVDMQFLLIKDISSEG